MNNDDLQTKIEKQIKAKEKRKKRNMRVSGKDVIKLKKIIADKS